MNFSTIWVIKSGRIRTFYNETMKNISIIIVTYNGKELLKKYLPSVLDACQHYSFNKAELIVVDDASVDGTVDYLRLNFPLIKLIEQPVNRGFASSVNLGVSCAQNEIVIPLNNDMRVPEDFLLVFPEHFEDRDVFAVRPGVTRNPEDKIFDLKNPEIGGGFKFGLFDLNKEAKKKTNLVFFTGGGCSAFDREKFIQLNGFDEIYSPFYFEDVDLSYRAWKRGWKIVYEPRTLIYHQGGATILKLYSRLFLDAIAERNRFLLVWKNITDWKLMLQNFIFVPIRVFGLLLKFRITPLVGFFWALGSLNEVIRKRRQERQFAKVKDKEIFALFNE